MKISIYALHLSFGGVEKYVATLAGMLAESHDVEIISTYKIDEKPAFHIDERVKITYLLDGLKPNKKEFKEAVSKRDIAGIFREGLVALKVLFARKAVNIKSLKACDGDVIISTRAFHNSLIGKYAPRSAVKITGEHNHHNDNKEYIDEVIASCRGFDYFIPISKELCDFYREPMKDIGVETKYIRFCIDKNESFREPSLDSFDLVSVGRLSPEKGAVDLVSVFEGIYRKNNKAKLHIVGDGADFEAVKSAVEEKGLSEAVCMHGFRDKKYIYELLPRCAVYVMTSYTESFGLVLLEAMSCGIPCVAFSSAQGAYEIIENGKNGYLIENRSFEDMQDKVCELLENRDELRRLSRGALETADEFSYERTKGSWLQLMEQIEKERINK